jgi:hypothetical protein
MRKFVVGRDESAARGYAEELRERKFDQIEPHLGPALRGRDSREMLAKMAALFPGEEPKSIKVVGSRRTTEGAGSSTAEFTLEYEFPRQWLLVEIATANERGTETITGFRVTPIAESLETLNRFTLAGKTARQYLTLLFAIASFLVSLYAFVLALRSKNFKRKWLWAVFALVGVSRFAVNWSTGEFHYTAPSVEIPSVGASRPFYGQWIIAGYFPLGALLVLQKSRRKRNTASGEVQP